MNNTPKTLPIVIGIIVILAVAGLIFFTRDTDDYQTPATATTTTSTATTTSGSEQSHAQTHTMAEVAQHNGANSCWTVIDGTVYDLTTWIGQHPGGRAAILSLCGADGTKAFRAQHDHAQQQESILATFKIGTLTQ